MSSHQEVAEIISRLDAYWHVLESDVVQLSKDISFCEGCLTRYGDVFAPSLEHLRRLRQNRKEAMQNIEGLLQDFSRNLSGGQRLLRDLERSVSLPGQDLSFKN
mmetsp:Transcript_32859/g.84863  ORF Transcript_32859/g.84863 Transcript_32859/m.84863 type:complete len:104 (-) Transcript_32859:219-530(-)